jgi:hypothetical protein
MDFDLAMPTFVIFDLTRACKIISGLLGQRGKTMEIKYRWKPPQVSDVHHHHTPIGGGF